MVVETSNNVIAHVAPAAEMGGGLLPLPSSLGIFNITH